MKRKLALSLVLLLLIGLLAGCKTEQKMKLSKGLIKLLPQLNLEN